MGRRHKFWDRNKIGDWVVLADMKNRAFGNKTTVRKDRWNDIQMMKNRNRDCLMHMIGRVSVDKEMHYCSSWLRRFLNGVRKDKECRRLLRRGLGYFCRRKGDVLGM